MRKKLIIALLLCLCMLMPLGGSALAAGQEAIPYVVDEAGILSGDEEDALEESASEIADRYACAPYILTVDDYTRYGSGDIFDTAMDIYEYLGLGYGQGKDGLLLLLSMEDRDYALVTYGNFTHSAFTDYGQEHLTDIFLEFFRRDDWYGGFESYLNTSADLMEQAVTGKPYDVGSAPKGFNFLIILIPLVIASVVCGIFAFQMKTARLSPEARDYVPGDGVNMRIVQDTFTHRSVMRQRINTQKSGGTSINSRGFSGRSGKF